MEPQLLDFSRTERLVFLIDLHPLLAVENPNPYITAVISAASRLLQFPPLSASLIAYKFFFSSLTPLRSADVLPRHLYTSSLSFDLPQETLGSLSTNINSISTLVNLPNSWGTPLASHTANALLQLIHDYTWENEQGNLLGKYEPINGEFVKIPSNLVLLFSPVNFWFNSIGLHDSDEGLVKFMDVFCAVNEGLVCRDMHLCWIDFNSDELQVEGVNEQKVDDNESGIQLANFVNGIKKIGWGFCSGYLFILGSSLLPLGLIYPKIGVSFNFLDSGGLHDKKCDGQLNLEILDVKGKPLEYKCCDLEFVKLKNLPSTIRYNEIFNIMESRDSLSEGYGKDTFLGHFDNGNIKLHIKTVCRYSKHEKIGGLLKNVLVRERVIETEKSRKKSSDFFFADRVLEMLHKEIGGVTYQSHIPTWQILLSFLHTKGYCAVVSLSGSIGDICTGILTPFTAHLAILSIMDHDNARLNGMSGSKLPKIDDTVSDTCAEDMTDSNRSLGSQTESSTSGNYELLRDGKRKKSQRHLYQQMTWSSFIKAALEGSHLDLFEVYISTKFENSKKLKFLKCWMKQIGKIDPCCLTTLHGSKSVEELSAGYEFSNIPSQAEQGAMPASNSETSENFFNNLSLRIQHGLESGVDLQSLARRVVKSSIHWLQQKSDTKDYSEDQSPMQNPNDSCSGTIDGKLIKLLLRKPKEIKKTHQDHEPSLKASDPCSLSDNIVRDYEFQIFLRMEILRSDVSAVIEESIKQKLLKQICSLLEIIQYLVAGGIHGHISLYDYVERTIKARYSEELEGVVRKIYTKMDLLPFGDEDESPSLLFNSEDSNQSWRDRYERHEKAETNSINNSISTEEEYSHPLANCNKSQQETTTDETTCLLNKARERRERARRFVSFTSRVPDLQRVWAPKQPKAIKGKNDSLPKKLKRKDWHRPNYSVVCETPMTGSKCVSSKVDREQEDTGNSSYSVSKALFQDI